MTTEENCIGWLSTNGLNRYRPLFVYMQYSLFVFGAIFWIDSHLSSHGFQESTWGSIAYIIPAKAWAAWNMGAAAITIIGLKKPVQSWMVAFGSFLHCLQFLLISISAQFSNGEMVVGLFASVYFLPLHMWLCYEAMRRWKN